MASATKQALLAALSAAQGECISGQQRRCLAEFFMAGCFPAPGIRIVHAGQIIMNERIAVNHLNAAGTTQ